MGARKRRGRASELPHGPCIFGGNGGWVWIRKFRELIVVNLGATETAHKELCGCWRVYSLVYTTFLGSLLVFHGYSLHPGSQGLANARDDVKELKSLRAQRSLHWDVLPDAGRLTTPLEKEEGGGGRARGERRAHYKKKKETMRS